PTPTGRGHLERPLLPVGGLSMDRRRPLSRLPRCRVEAVEMASFRDRVLLALSDPTRLGAVLLPAADTQGAPIRTALGATYDLAAARVDQVRSVTVQEVLVEHSLLPVSHQIGAWTQTVPSFTRTEFTLDRPVPTTPVWIDLLAQVAVTVVTEID